MSRRAIILSERNDIFNSTLRLPVAMAIAIYVAFTAFSRSSLEPAGQGSNQNLITHHARDTRARMMLQSPFNTLHLHLHTAMATAALVLMLYQKELMFRASLDPAAALPRNHRVVGCVTCVMMFGLAALGYCMRHSPALPHFDSFSIAFAAPWYPPCNPASCPSSLSPRLLSRLAWSFLIPLTARYRFLRLHQLLSNMALKACLAVPCARLATAIVQATSTACTAPPSALLLFSRAF
jgi:hypothetical protein